MQQGGLQSSMPQSSLSTPKHSDDDEDDPGSPRRKEKEKAGDYDYLLGMPLWSLTWEKVKELNKVQKEKRGELDILIHTSPEQMWEKDLIELQEALTTAWNEEREEEQKALAAAHAAFSIPSSKKKKKEEEPGAATTSADGFLWPSPTKLQD